MSAADSITRDAKVYKILSEGKCNLKELWFFAKLHTKKLDYYGLITEFIDQETWHGRPARGFVTRVHEGFLISLFTGRMPAPRA